MVSPLIGEPTRCHRLTGAMLHLTPVHCVGLERVGLERSLDSGKIAEILPAIHRYLTKLPEPVRDSGESNKDTNKNKLAILLAFTHKSGG